MGNPPAELVHMHDDELLDYFEEKLSDQRAQAIERHIAACDGCTLRAREVHALHEIWESWSAAEHGRALQQERVQQALREAEQMPDLPKERLRRWRTRFGGLSEVALQFVTRITAGVGEVIASGVDSLARPGSQWVLRPVLETRFVRGGGGAPRDVVELATSPSGASARVVVHAAEHGDVTVRIDELGDRKTPLVLLVAVGGDAGPACVAEAAASTDRRHAVARFSGVAPGNYLVLVEPLDPAEERDR